MGDRQGEVSGGESCIWVFDVATPIELAIVECCMIVLLVNSAISISSMVIM